MVAIVWVRHGSGTGIGFGAGVARLFGVVIKGENEDSSSVVKRYFQSLGTSQRVADSEELSNLKGIFVIVSKENKQSDVCVGVVNSMERSEERKGGQS